MKKVKAKGGFCVLDRKKPCILNKSLKKRNGAIRVNLIQKNTSFTILKPLKIQVLIMLTYRLQRTLTTRNTYIVA